MISEGEKEREELRCVWKEGLEWEGRGGRLCVLADGGSEGARGRRDGGDEDGECVVEGAVCLAGVDAGGDDGGE